MFIWFKRSDTEFGLVSLLDSVSQVFLGWIRQTVSTKWKRQKDKVLESIFTISGRPVNKMMTLSRLSRNIYRERSEGADLHPGIAIWGKRDGKWNLSKDCKSSDCRPNKPNEKVAEKRMITKKNTRKLDCNKPSVFMIIKLAIQKYDNILTFVKKKFDYENVKF